MSNNYEYYDPNAPITRKIEGDNYNIFDYGVCISGKAIKVYLNGSEVMFSCCNPETLTITAKTDKYDCINGLCTSQSTYNTAGLYNSLSDCQAVCANGGACAEGKQCVDPTTFCPDGKVCIDQGEFQSIEALISKIGSEVC